jgi:hypothetical protein
MQIKDNDAAIVAPLIERNNETQWWINAAFFGSKRRSLVPVMWMVMEHQKVVKFFAWKTVL